ncbi:MAG TPA: AAA family ATPase [Ignavibacteriales bacterium]|nr:AAA family ATPase [Ignavibacteriales bacterium]
MEFNKELIAIIGNKGSGKSAIADIIALCANYKNHEYFSFLKDGKFRDGRIAQNFEASLIWEDNITQPYYSLNKKFNEKEGLIEKVKYLPQGYFENLCNETSTANSFKKEIENVVFQHLKEEEKREFNNFQELIDWKKNIVDKEIALFKEQLIEKSKEIIKLETKRNTKYAQEINNTILQKEQELNALKEPAKIEDPTADPIIAETSKITLRNINQLKKEITEIAEKIEQKRLEKISIINEVDDIKRIKEEITLSISELELIKTKHKIRLFEDYKINIDDILTIKHNYNSLDLLISKKENDINKLRYELGEIKQEIAGGEINLTKILSDKKKKYEEEQNKLDVPQKNYQKYLADVDMWKKQKRNIEGDEAKFGTLKWLEKEKEFIENNLENEISKQYEEIISTVKEIYKKKETIISIYTTVKKRIDEIININKDLLKDYEIVIDASLTINPDFEFKFFNFINQSVKGSFHGQSDGSSMLRRCLHSKDTNNINDMEMLIKEIIEFLKFDKRSRQNNEQRFIDDQIQDIENFFNFIFSLDYLGYNYNLKLGDKTIESLSPGEKGALLLVFYLLLDKDESPLILDQPEDNLDNNSVANILVPFIKNAKKRRQIVMVTHNPNLAVVADAEQIIHVNIDKKMQNKFSYNSGSIENKEINKCIVDVLEGTMPAFNHRQKKYHEQVSRV